MLKRERVSLHTKNDRNLTWALILLLLSGVLCREWKVQYDQDNICAVKGSSVVILCSFDYPKKLTVQSVKWGHERNIFSGPFLFDSESKNNLLRFEYIGDKHHNCSFKIHQVQHNDSGKHAFRFTIVSEDNKVDRWTGVDGSRLKVVDLKVQVAKPNENETVKEGDSVNLTCINGCDGSLPSTFTWFKNGEPINEGHVLHLSNISYTNSGNYTCSLKKLQTQTTSGVQIIDVEYGPKNTYVRPSSEVDEEDNVNLICSSDAVPPVERYTWLKISENDRNVGNGSELILNETYPPHGGQYICRATNKHGHQDSSTVTIKVKAKWSTFTTTVPIVATVAALLIVAVIIAVRRCNTKRTKTPETTPESDYVEDIQNTIYINLPVFENNKSQEQNQCEELTIDVIYSTVCFTKRNMQQQTDCCNDDEGVIYSTVCRDHTLDCSQTEPL